MEELKYLDRELTLIGFEDRFGDIYASFTRCNAEYMLDLFNNTDIFNYIDQKYFINKGPYIGVIKSENLKDFLNEFETYFKSQKLNIIVTYTKGSKYAFIKKKSFSSYNENLIEINETFVEKEKENGKWSKNSGCFVIQDLDNPKNIKVFNSMLLYTKNGQWKHIRYNASSFKK